MGIKGLDKLIDLQDVEVPRIPKQSAHEGGKIVSPCTGELLLFSVRD